MVRQCNQAIQFRGRSGTLVSPAVTFLCSLPAGHDGPCMSPSLQRSVSERNQWTKDHPQGSGEDPFADEDPPLGAPKGSKMVRCPECSAEIPSFDAVPHLLTHRRSVPAPPAPPSVSLAEWATLETWMASAPAEVTQIWSRCASFLLSALGPNH